MATATGYSRLVVCNNIVVYMIGDVTDEYKFQLIDRNNSLLYVVTGHRKLRAFVTHGGLLSLFESVYHGIPGM